MSKRQTPQISTHKHQQHCVGAPFGRPWKITFCTMYRHHRRYESRGGYVLRTQVLRYPPGGETPPLQCTLRGGGAFRLYCSSVFAHFVRTPPSAPRPPPLSGEALRALNFQFAISPAPKGHLASPERGGARRAERCAPKARLVKAPNPTNQHPQTSAALCRGGVPPPVVYHRTHVRSAYLPAAFKSSMMATTRQNVILPGGETPPLQCTLRCGGACRWDRTSDTAPYPIIPFTKISTPIQTRITPPTIAALPPSALPARLPISRPPMQMMNVTKAIISEQTAAAAGP